MKKTIFAIEIILLTANSDFFFFKSLLSEADTYKKIAFTNYFLLYYSVPRPRVLGRRGVERTLIPIQRLFYTVLQLNICNERAYRT